MRKGRDRASERGFTLLELLVTLTIAGLLIAIAAPRMADSVSHARLRATAEQVASVLRDARAVARQTAQPAAFTIADAGRSFTAAGRQVTLPSGESLAFRPFARSEGDQHVAQRLEFLPEGGATGGAIEISDGRARIRVEVDWLSGRVSIRD